MQLTSTTVEGLVIKHLQVGAAQLTFESSPTDPLGRIPVLEILNASYSESSFVLGYGQVVHDYRSDTKGTGNTSAD
jgi:acetoacetate decarboxylase